LRYANTDRSGSRQSGVTAGASVVGGAVWSIRAPIGGIQTVERDEARIDMAKTAREVMTPEARCVGENDTVAEAAGLVEANDEWLGVVTLEDVLEQIVGSIEDEFD
jgi:CBS domain-containing protein